MDKVYTHNNINSVSFHLITQHSVYTYFGSEDGKIGVRFIASEDYPISKLCSKKKAAVILSLVSDGRADVFTIVVVQ